MTDIENKILHSNIELVYNNAKVTTQIAKYLANINNKYILKLKYSKKTILN